MCIAALPVVTDKEFVEGMSFIPSPPTFTTEADDCWVDVAHHVLARGLGLHPEVVPRPNVDLREAFRFLGAMMATPAAKQGGDLKEEHIAAWLKVMFSLIRPEDGPLATAHCANEV